MYCPWTITGNVSSAPAAGRRGALIAEGELDQRVLRTSLGDDLRFARVPVAFEPGTLANLFALKNNKTVRRSRKRCSIRRYSGLSSVIPLGYQAALQTPLGNSLGRMKVEGELTCRGFE